MIFYFCVPSSHREPVPLCISELQAKICKECNLKASGAQTFIWVGDRNGRIQWMQWPTLIGPVLLLTEHFRTNSSSGTFQDGYAGKSAVVSKNISIFLVLAVNSRKMKFREGCRHGPEKENTKSENGGNRTWG
jgi:hypothetical protein